MSYRMVHSSAAEKAPESPGVLGYFYNHGGLNNQKMALLGLMLAGISQGAPINLPYVYNRDQKTDQEYLVRIEEIFDLDRILDFGRRHGLVIRTDCPGGERGGWDYFAAFSDRLRASMQDRGQVETTFDALSSLRPRIVATPAFIRLKDAVHENARIDTVVQLRIEADWQTHAEHLGKLYGSEHGDGLGYSGILAKVRATFPDLQKIYVTSDENSMPVSKYEIRAVARARFDIGLSWKSDLLTGVDANQLTPLDLSIIDFEIARLSPRFVGLTSSTFACMLAAERLASTRKIVRGHYYYNSVQPVVVEWTDIGFQHAAQIETLFADSDTA